MTSKKVFLISFLSGLGFFSIPVYFLVADADHVFNVVEPGARLNIPEISEKIEESSEEEIPKYWHLKAIASIDEDGEPNISFKDFGAVSSCPQGTNSIAGSLGEFSIKEGHVALSVEKDLCFFASADKSSQNLIASDYGSAISGFESVSVERGSYKEIVVESDRGAYKVGAMSSWVLACEGTCLKTTTQILIRPFSEDIRFRLPSVSTEFEEQAVSY